MKRYWAVLAAPLLALLMGCDGGLEGKPHLVRHAGITIGEAALVAESLHEGRAIKADLKATARNVLYEIEVVDRSMNGYLVHVDAETGKVLRTRQLE